MTTAVCFVGTNSTLDEGVFSGLVNFGRQNKVLTSNSLLLLRSGLSIITLGLCKSLNKFNNDNHSLLTQIN
ncbi:hypothetical protein PRUPE_1G328700 [Prunus persica]|uniref:Uncharacterized protein n=1 Tax=Prunus persica TaxID=3760 RepID=M5Y595_PRUPE|nr:hypothetical protein PRUPE_1G328700 [Prunus persica]